jgi:hypothetical protein
MKLLTLKSTRDQNRTIFTDKCNNKNILQNIPIFRANNLVGVLESVKTSFA